MSFSSLPPELVHQIIESTVPHSFHSATYNVRQDTLCRLSLVSRQFRSIAQPLLFKIAFVKDDDQLCLILGDDGKVLARQLILHAVPGALSSELIKDLVGGAQNLRSSNLRSNDGEIIDIGALTLCKNLVNLQLAGDGFHADSLRVLPSLQALSLNFQTARTLEELLDPRTVPALKALGLEFLDQPEELERLRTTRIDELLPQLEAICVEVDLYRLAKDTLLLNLESRTLVAAYPDDIRLSPQVESFSTIQHLRIEIHNNLTNRGRLVAIQGVLEILRDSQQAKPRQLRSIYLELEVHPVVSDAENVREEFTRLKEECRESGVDLIFESQGRNYELDTYISPEFCRRQRKARERVK